MGLCNFLRQKRCDVFDISSWWGRLTTNVTHVAITMTPSSRWRHSQRTPVTFWSLWGPAGLPLLTPTIGQGQCRVFFIWTFLLLLSWTNDKKSWISSASGAHTTLTTWRRSSGTPAVRTWGASWRGTAWSLGSAAMMRPWRPWELSVRGRQQSYTVYQIKKGLSQKHKKYKYKTKKFEISTKIF